MPNLRAAPVAFLCCFVVSALAVAGGPFLDLGLDDALARAKAEKKIVFIDFFATWCGPCKQLDSTTFADEKVVAWLNGNTVAVKIDVDEDKEIAKRFKVSAMPTLVFLTADGTELERIRGFRDADAFLAAAKAVAEHPEMDAVTRARAELASGSMPEAMAREKLATALLMNGEQAEALAEYRKALDSLGTDFMSLQYRPRLLHEICSMAEDYAPAREVLIVMRTNQVARLENGDGDRNDVEQIVAIDKGLDQQEKSLELYERLKARGDIPDETLAGFASTCREILLERREYQVLGADNARQVSMALLLIESLRMQRKIVAGDDSGMPDQMTGEIRKRLAEMTEEQKADFLASTERYLVNRVAEEYEIARGAGKEDDATTLAEKLLECCPTAEAHHALAAHALRSGKPAQADLGYAAKAVALDKGQTPEYVLTRFELMEHLEKANDEVTGGAEAQ